MGLTAEIVWNVTDYSEDRFGALDMYGQFFRTADGLGMVFECPNGCCNDLFVSKQEFLKKNSSRVFYRIDPAQ
jgi:hypothetical protein